MKWVLFRIISIEQVLISFIILLNLDVPGIQFKVWPWFKGTKAVSKVYKLR